MIETNIRTRLRKSNSGPWFDEAAGRLAAYLRERGGSIPAKELAKVHPSFDGLGPGLAEATGLLSAAGTYRDRAGGDFIRFGNAKLERYDPRRAYVRSPRGRSPRDRRPDGQKPGHVASSRATLKGADALQKALHAETEPDRSRTKAIQVSLSAIAADLEDDEITVMVAADRCWRPTVGAAAWYWKSERWLGAVSRMVKRGLAAAPPDGSLSLTHAGQQAVKHVPPEVVRWALTRLEAIHGSRKYRREHEERVSNKRLLEISELSSAAEAMLTAVMGTLRPKLRFGVSEAPAADAAVAATLGAGRSMTISKLVRLTGIQHEKMYMALDRLKACGAVEIQGVRVTPIVDADARAIDLGMPSAFARVWLAASRMSRFRTEEIAAVLEMSDCSGERPALHILRDMQNRGHLENDSHGSWNLTVAGASFLEFARGIIASLPQDNRLREAYAQVGKALFRWERRSRADGSWPTFMELAGQLETECRDIPAGWTFPPTPGDVRAFGLVGEWSGPHDQEDGSLESRIMEALSCGTLTADELADCVRAPQAETCRILSLLAARGLVKDVSKGVQARNAAWKRYCARMLDAASRIDGSIVLDEILKEVPGSVPDEAWAAICFLCDKGVIEPSRWNYPACPEAPSRLYPGRPLTLEPGPDPETSAGRAVAMAREAPRTRSELGKALGLSREAIRKLANRLVDRGLLVVFSPDGEPLSRGTYLPGSYLAAAQWTHEEVREFVDVRRADNQLCNHPN